VRDLQRPGAAQNAVIKKSSAASPY
jgi:hypothetical protein